MLVAAALVPDTVLLVPGASGVTDVHGDLRSHALDAVRSVLARHVERVVVVAPGTGSGDSGPVRVTPAPVRASLAAAGIPDGALGWPTPGETPTAGGPAAGGTQDARDAGLDATEGTGSATRAVGVSASVAVLLLRQAGWAGPVDVVETAPTARADRSSAARLVATGRDLAPVGAPRTGLVVVGSLSARHGPDAPRADDERAPGYDAAVLADLADAGADALTRLGSLDPGLAGELDVTGWGPWQVLLGALPRDGAVDAPPERAVTATVHTAQAPLGAQHVVATWVVAHDPATRAGSRASVRRPAAPSEDTHA
ncbi:hypothetical protein [Cellulomonas sp. NS3]|uniref:hypothetical protein n=1 Tax=Cellulomonas sp. NS3 TaxID=2973977 RepID=UPI0021633D69|nr:hypothetical protein [Cellulomonas sp. NS3]